MAALMPSKQNEFAPVAAPHPRRELACRQFRLHPLPVNTGRGQILRYFMGLIAPQKTGNALSPSAYGESAEATLEQRDKGPRVRGVSLFGVVVLLFLVMISLPAIAGPLIEPPSLAEQVKAGKLAPVEQRVPSEPRVIALDGPGLSIGRHGGMMTQLMERASDIKRMSAYGYARLVGYNTAYAIEPDILKAYEVKDGRDFTLTLRAGHRWSDGQPFTTEDFRYYWEDMALNTELFPDGPDKEMLVDGEKPDVEVISATMIRYRWSKPNAFFLTALAGATPMYIFRPAHHLKRFHKRYAKPDKLDEQIKKRNRRDWVDLHFNRDRVYRLDSTDMPTLDPWVNTTQSPADRYVFERNPYYHRVDTEGRQLPYVDQIAVTIAAAKLIPPKIGAGESELQARSLQFNNYTVLKRGETRHGYKVGLWRGARGSQIALFPNLNASDPIWREALRDVRLRRALSLAIDRREVNQVIYFGLAKEGNNTVLADSPLFRDDLRTRWAEFDVAAANRLLDEMGLLKRDARGVRLLRDGRPLEIIVETAGDGAEHTDVLELVRDNWAKIGVALFIKPQTRETLNRRVAAGATLMSVFFGLDNGIPTAATPPVELAPTNERQLQWPQWGLYAASNGKSGAPIDMVEPLQLDQLYKKWAVTTDDTEKATIWAAMLDIHADQQFTIGIVNTVPQPVVISNRLRNVPASAIYSWEPGAHFGVFRPDTFWLEPVAKKEGS
jgi:peptide/nickel transport system substrate-binding protein